MATIHSLLGTLQTNLQAKTWPSGDKVFGQKSVIVTNGIAEQALHTLRVPIAMIRTGSGQSDPLHDEEPDYMVTTVTIRIVMQHHGDATGEFAVMGGHKSGGATSSKGRGLLEIEEQVHDVIGKLTTANSINIQFRRKGEVGADYIDAQKQYWAWRDLEFEAVVTAT